MSAIPDSLTTIYLHRTRTRIREIALSRRVSGVRVFGSAIRNDDVEGSDLDLLVEPTAQTTLMDIGAIRHGDEGRQDHDDGPGHDLDGSHQGHDGRNRDEERRQQDDDEERRRNGHVRHDEEVKP